jgi:hypothetical protein
MATEQQSPATTAVVPKRSTAVTAPAEAADNSVDFDDMLPHLGEFGRYQKMLFLLLAPFMFFVAFVYFSQIFITLTPDHWCRVPGLEFLTPEER